MSNDVSWSVRYRERMGLLILYPDQNLLWGRPAQCKRIKAVIRQYNNDVSIDLAEHLRQAEWVVRGTPKIWMEIFDIQGLRHVSYGAQSKRTAEFHQLSVPEASSLMNCFQSRIVLL